MRTYACLNLIFKPLSFQFVSHWSDCNKRVEHVYFPEGGVVFVVANGEHTIEIGIIGREGMSGVSLVLGDNEKSPHDTYVQIAGNAQRISVSNLLAAIEESRTLHKELLEVRQQVPHPDYGDRPRQRTPQNRRTVSPLDTDGSRPLRQRSGSPDPRVPRCHDWNVQTRC